MTVLGDDNRGLSRALIFRGADGRRYIARSIEKSPYQFIPDWLRSAGMFQYTQDMVAAHHPTGELVAHHLLTAVVPPGLHVPSMDLWVLPDDPRLGAYREEFGGMLVLWSEMDPAQARVPETDELVRSTIDAVAALPLSDTRRSLFVLLGQVQKTFGQAPYMRSAALGGSRSLRGFADRRFAGQASVFASAEFRAQVFSQYSLLFPTDLGVIVFGDAGRVFVDDEASNLIHTSVGFGIWASPTITGIRSLEGLQLNAEIAFSHENTSLYFRFGYRF